MSLPCVELEVSLLCRSEEKQNHVLKTDGDKLRFAGNFKMELCLNRGLVWEFLGLKLVILTALFC